MLEEGSLQKAVAGVASSKALRPREAALPLIDCRHYTATPRSILMNSTNEPCPVCGTKAQLQRTADRTLIKCSRCGSFGLSDTALTLLPTHATTQRSRALLSHYVRRMQRTDRWPIATWEVLENVLKTASLPTPREQADNVIRLLGDLLEDDPGSEVELDDSRVGGVVGTSSQAVSYTHLTLPTILRV